MNKKPWKVYAFWIVLCEGVGIASGLLSREGMALYREMTIKPPLTPPGWVFGVVWAVLYALMGISAARVRLAPASGDSRRGMNVFVAQLVVNFFWSLIFFNARAWAPALVWLILLWALVAVMIRRFCKVDKPAAALQIPYLIWLTFAGYLNWGVWQLNR